MNRREVDFFVALHRLPLTTVDTILSLIGARPTRLQTQRFVASVLQLGGLFSLAAGVIFFFAANWPKISVLQRFALLESVLLACIVAALLRQPPKLLGRCALLGAFIATGVLLALFGQSYQTGADLYELFFVWSLLGLPFVLATRWSVGWAVWIAVVNVALLLFCGSVPGRSAIWIIFAIWGFTPALLMLAAMAANLVVWSIGEWLSRKHAIGWISSWLLRLPIAAAVGFGTWAGIVALVSDRDDYRMLSTGRPFALSLYVLLTGSLVIYVYRRRRDVFPLAAMAASLIALLTVEIGKSFAQSSDLGIWFMMAIWLIASSTFAGKWLMRILHTWREAVQG